MLTEGGDPGDGDGGVGVPGDCVAGVEEVTEDGGPGDDEVAGVCDDTPESCVNDGWSTYGFT